MMGCVSSSLTVSTLHLNLFQTKQTWQKVFWGKENVGFIFKEESTFAKEYFRKRAYFIQT